MREEPLPDIEIFLGAPEGASGRELEAYLDEACGSDRELREKVVALFAAEDQGQDLLRADPYEQVAQSTGAAADSEGEGETIGAYKLLQRIGEGGFGEVFMADQLAPVKRKVALKIIKRGMDTRQVVARFEVERQALAMMDHPNIARVFDAGATASGRPYFVMELVRGVPITEFCANQALDARARLELFMEVCSAVQHAHQKGIVHRDLKPNNVLITMHDDKPVPKVIDFGVAKATQADLTDKTLFTRYEQFIGTPAYMSPEQAQMSGLDIDTRSDIYSLGVLLYELLTGTTPLDPDTLREAGQDEVRRVIREVDPPLPSTRLTELQKRSVSQPALAITANMVEQDLDWIVMKALEKDRARRYETASSFAADIRRHLNNEPIEAGSPSLAYRMAKFARRHRSALVAGGSIAAVVIIGALVAALLAVEATRARDEARESAEAAVAARNEADEVGEAAIRDRDQARLLFAEERLAAGKTEVGIAHLAKLIREKSGNHKLAAQRLFSAIWSREFPERLHRFEKFGHAAVDLSRDGTLILTGSEDGVVRVFDSQSGEPHQDGKELIAIPNTPVRYVEFSPSEDLALAVVKLADPETSTFQVHVWNWKTGRQACVPLQREGGWLEARFSPDGKSVVAWNWTQAQCWEIEGGRPRFGSPLRRVGAQICFSADGRRLLASGGDGTAFLYDNDTSPGQQLQTFPHGDLDEVRMARFDADGHRVVTAATDRTARVWEADSGKLLHVLEHLDEVVDARFSDDGRLVATASWDGTAKVWNAESGALLHQLDHPGQKVASVQFLDDAQRVVTSSRSRDVMLWDISLGTPTKRSYGKSFLFHSVHLSGDGELLLSAGDFSAATLWRIGARQPRSLILRHLPAPGRAAFADFVGLANFSPDGAQIVSGGADPAVRIWDAWSGIPRFELTDLPATHWFTEFSSDGELILATSDDVGFGVWEVSSRRMLCRVPVGGELRHATFSPVKVDGDYLVAVAPLVGEAVQLYNARTGAKVGPPLPHAGPGSKSYLILSGSRVRFSPEGSRLVTCTDDGSARVFSVPDGELVVELSGKDGHRDLIQGVWFSRDGRRVVTASDDGTARVWWVAGERAGSVEYILHHGQEVVGHAEFSPDGTRVVTASTDGSARIWETTAGDPNGPGMEPKSAQQVGLTLLHDHTVLSARFSPDGKRIVTGAFDFTARVWDAATGHALSEPLAHAGFVFSAGFSPDGRRVVSSGDDRTARVWELPPAPGGKVPEWVADWAEAIAGVSVDDEGTLTPVPPAAQTKAEELVRALPEDEYYARTAKWFYQDRATRPISPFSRLTVDQWVENRIREGEVSSLEDALEVEPDHSGAMADLARLLIEPPHRLDPKNLLRAESLIRRASDLEPGRQEYAELFQRVTVERRALERSKQLRQLEARAMEAIGRGALEVGKHLLAEVAMDRALLAARADWPGRSAGRAIMSPWHALIPRSQLISEGALWRYYDGSEPIGSPSWRERDFDDANWKRGAAPLGYGKDGEVTLLDQGEEGARRVAFYFRKRFNWSPDEHALSHPQLTLRLRRDDGAVVYLNGKEIVRSNMPEGKITEETLAASTVGTRVEKDFLDYTLDAGMLVEGENVLAVEVHQVNSTSSDVSFDLELLVGEHSGRQLRELVPIAATDPGTTARVLWILGEYGEALEAIDQVLAGLSDPREVRMRKEWLRRKAEIFQQAGRPEEAEAILEQVAAYPPRPPELDSRFVDLSPLYNENLYGRDRPTEASAAEAMEHLAETFDPGDGPTFDIRGFIQLNSGELPEDRQHEAADFNARTGSDRPMRVTIPVKEKASKLHFLHACHWGREKIGAEVARYVIHFEDGTSESCAVIFGVHMTDHWIHGRPAEELAGIAHFVWTREFKMDTGTGTLGLTRQTWENEDHSDKTISHLEFISTGAKAAPFLVAVTLE